MPTTARLPDGTIGTGVRFGWEIHHLASVGSTNDAAAAMPAWSAVRPIARPVVGGVINAPGCRMTAGCGFRRWFPPGRRKRAGPPCPWRLDSWCVRRCNRSGRRPCGSAGPTTS